jgi:hypothetical protein
LESNAERGKNETRLHLQHVVACIDVSLSACQELESAIHKLMHLATEEQLDSGFVTTTRSSVE